ncbi:MAG: hypothetical protein RBU30_26295, partial [Polyangia bacterium]|nr:hypothetical protein [Polyangia bacterium]
MPPAPTRGTPGPPLAAPSHFRYIHQPDADVERAARVLAAALDISPITAQVLARRGVCSESAAQAYLKPRLANLLDPASMADFKRTVTRIADAVERAERIGVFGDYDVDGITATAVITETLTGSGLAPELRLESRDNGYGLSVRDLEAFHEAGCRLVVACDVG